MAEPNQDEIPTLAQLAAAMVGRDINENILSKIEAEERKRRDSRIDMLHEDEARVIAIVKQNFLKKREQVREEYRKRIDQRERSVSGLERAKEELSVAVPTSLCGNCRRVLNTTRICSVKDCMMNETCKICDEEYNIYKECRICEVMLCSNHYLDHYKECRRNEKGRCGCGCGLRSRDCAHRKRKNMSRNLYIVKATQFLAPPKPRVRGGTSKRARS